MDGGTGSDTLQVSTGTHTFSSNGNLSNISTILADVSGSTINLDGQNEGFTITGNNGDDTLRVVLERILFKERDNDNLTGGSGADTFKVESGTDIINFLGGEGAGGESIF